MSQQANISEAEDVQQLRQLSMEGLRDSIMTSFDECTVTDRFKEYLNRGGSVSADPEIQVRLFEALQREKFEQERLHREKLQAEEKLKAEERLQAEKLQRENLQRARTQQAKLRPEKLQQEALQQEKYHREKLQAKEKLQRQLLQERKFEQEKIQQKKVQQEALQLQRQLLKPPTNKPKHTQHGNPDVAARNPSTQSSGSVIFWNHFTVALLASSAIGLCVALWLDFKQSGTTCRQRRLTRFSKQF